MEISVEITYKCTTHEERLALLYQEGDDITRAALEKHHGISENNAYSIIKRLEDEEETNPLHFVNWAREEIKNIKTLRKRLIRAEEIEITSDLINFLSEQNKLKELLEEE